MTRGELIQHCEKALKQKRFLLVKYYGGITGLNPRIIKIIDREGLDKKVIAESVKYCSITEYISFKMKNSFI